MKVRTLAWMILIVIILIAIFHNQYAWLADLFIDPSSKIPSVEVPTLN